MNKETGQEIISQGSIAVIFKMHSCTCINITLPNLNIHLDHVSFLSFSSLIDRITEDHRNDGNEELLVFVSIGCQGVDLHFKLRQIRELRRILRKAAFKLNTRALGIKAAYSDN